VVGFDRPATKREEQIVAVKSKFTKADPPRPIVGSDYYFRSGAVRSRAQMKRLERAGRISRFFRVGSRLGQWKDVADADIAGLIEQEPAA
jgi:hypothetical protein